MNMDPIDFYDKPAVNPPNPLHQGGINSARHSERSEGISCDADDTDCYEGVATDFTGDADFHVLGLHLVNPPDPLRQGGSLKTAIIQCISERY